VSKKSKAAMLFPKRKEENLLRQSLLNRFKARLLKKEGVTKHKEKVHRCTSDLSGIGERARAWSLPSEAELKKYLGPVDERLVENAEIAKRRRRTDDRRYSIQIDYSSDLRSLDGEARPRTTSLPARRRYFSSQQTPFNFVRCKWCEPIELPGTLEHNDSDDETYIDENGIYTTVLCFTEI
jgi:hypothetical protein